MVMPVCRVLFFFFFAYLRVESETIREINTMREHESVRGESK